MAYVDLPTVTIRICPKKLGEKSYMDGMDYGWLLVPTQMNWLHIQRNLPKMTWTQQFNQCVHIFFWNSHKPLSQEGLKVPVLFLDVNSSITLTCLETGETKKGIMCRWDGCRPNCPFYRFLSWWSVQGTWMALIRGTSLSLQGTITYPTWGQRKIIDSKVWFFFFRYLHFLGTWNVWWQ